MLELECKCNQLDFDLQRTMEDSDSLHYNEEIQNMQSVAWEHSLRIFKRSAEKAVG